jgi:hypothetical protein
MKRFRSATFIDVLSPFKSDGKVRKGESIKRQNKHIYTYFIKH